MNKTLILEVPLKMFMVGQIIGILDEMQGLIVIEVFSHKKYKFKSKIDFATPFVYIDDL